MPGILQLRLASCVEVKGAGPRRAAAHSLQETILFSRSSAIFFKRRSNVGFPEKCIVIQ